MRLLIIAISMLVSALALSKRKITPTEFITIKGKVKKELTITLAELDTFPKRKIGPQVIYNQKGEVKDTIKSMVGVALKDILKQIDFVYDNPRQLNEFYFIFKASDGYKVVFTWNEIFNTETGNYFYLITETEGTKLKNMNDRIKFMSTHDLKVGRRNIKALESIEVKQIE